MSKEKYIRVANKFIARLEKKPRRSMRENEQLKLMKAYRDDMINCTTKEAEDQLVNFMKGVMKELGFPYKHLL